MLYFLWGCRRNVKFITFWVKLITVGIERVNILNFNHFSTGRHAWSTFLMPFFFSQNANLDSYAACHPTFLAEKPLQRNLSYYQLTISQQRSVSSYHLTISQQRSLSSYQPTISKQRSLSSYHLTISQQRSLSSYQPTISQQRSLSSYHLTISQQRSLSSYQPTISQQRNLSSYQLTISQQRNLSSYQLTISQQQVSKLHSDFCEGCQFWGIPVWTTWPLW